MGTRRGTFEIDHYIPQSQRPDLRDAYDNLLYTCASCNRLKQDFEVADPGRIALADCVEVQADGKIRWLNKDGHRLVRVLGLDDPTLELFRADLMAAIKESEAEYLRRMRYPDDLPDLTVLPIPPSNSKSNGVSQSFFARSERGELAEVY